MRHIGSQDARQIRRAASGFEPGDHGADTGPDAAHGIQWALYEVS